MFLSHPLPESCSICSWSSTAHRGALTSTAPPPPPPVDGLQAFPGSCRWLSSLRFSWRQLVWCLWRLRHCVAVDVSGSLCARGSTMATFLAAAFASQFFTFLFPVFCHVVIPPPVVVFHRSHAEWKVGPKFPFPTWFSVTQSVHVVLTDVHPELKLQSGRRLHDHRGDHLPVRSR